MFEKVSKVQPSVSNLLQVVIQSLDTFHNLPFEDDWTTQPIGASYQGLLSEMESVLLDAWKLYDQSESTLQETLHSWEISQRRSDSSILKHYYNLYQALELWHQQQAELGGQGHWQDYISWVLCRKNHYLRKLIQGPHQAEPKALGLLVDHYLILMQRIYDADPYTICEDFFQWITSITGSPYFIPRLSFPATSSSGQVTSETQKPTDPLIDYYVTKLEPLTTPESSH